MSYLTGEQADCIRDGRATGWLSSASEDFDGHLAERRSIRTRWGVPTTILWYVSGEHYLGTLVIRHELTYALATTGGHIGFHVVFPWRRQGHGTRMLRLALVECQRLGLREVLLTCDPANEPSKRVILANGAIAAGRAGGEDHFWISLQTEHGR